MVQELCLITLALTCIVQFLMIGRYNKKLKEVKAELDYAHSAEGQRKITMNTIKNRMWY